MFSTVSSVKVTLMVDPPVDIPFSLGEQNSLTLISNARYATTVGTLVFVDSFGLFNNYALTDGLPIEYNYEVAGAKFQRRHRIFHVSKVEGNSGSIYQIETYPDKPSWLIGSTNRILRGTSSDIISQLAQSCGIQVETDPTSDSMNWCGANRRISNFARFICDHGYVNDDSLMVLGYNQNDKLLYRNWNALDVQNITKGFSYVPDAISVQIYSHAVESESGFLNLYSGYQHRFVEQKLSGQTHHDRIRVRQLSDNLMVNPDIKAQVKAGRVEFGPILCTGNTHDNYMRAYYQNARGRFALSTGLKVESNWLSDIDIFEAVRVNVDSNTTVTAKDTPRTLFDGEYIVTAKSVSIHANRYFEAFMLTRDGMNNPQRNRQ